VCDVYASPNLEKGRFEAGLGRRALRDFRKLLDDKTIDVVNQPPTLAALPTVMAAGG